MKKHIFSHRFVSVAIRHRPRHCNGHSIRRFPSAGISPLRKHQAATDEQLGLRILRQTVCDKELLCQT